MARTKDEQDQDRDGRVDGPRQTVRRMPDNQPDVGPYFPSGMGADEAALAGATDGMSDREIAVLHGEDPDDRKAINKKKDND